MAKPTLWDHPKTKALARQLGIKRYAAFGLASRLFDVTATLTPQGDIGKLGAEEIADQLGWDGDPPKLVEGLTDVGFLDWHGKRNKVLIVHGWAEHAGEFTHARLARAHLFFITGETPSLRKLEADQRRNAEVFYTETELKRGHPPAVRRTSKGRRPAPSLSSTNTKEIRSLDVRRSIVFRSMPSLPSNCSNNERSELESDNEGDRNLHQIMDRLKSEKGPA